MAKSDLWQRLNAEVSLANVKALLTGAPMNHPSDTADLQADQILAYAEKEARLRNKPIEVVLAELGFSNSIQSQSSSEPGTRRDRVPTPPQVTTLNLDIPQELPPQPTPPNPQVLQMSQNSFSSPSPQPQELPDARTRVMQEWQAMLRMHLSPITDEQLEPLLSRLETEGREAATSRLGCLYPEHAALCQTAATAAVPFWLALLQQGLPHSALADLLRCDPAFPAQGSGNLEKASIPSRKPAKALSNAVPKEWLTSFALAPLRKSGSTLVVALAFVPPARFIQEFAQALRHEPQLVLTTLDELAALRAHFLASPEPSSRTSRKVQAQAVVAPLTPPAAPVVPAVAPPPVIPTAAALVAPAPIAAAPIAAPPAPQPPQIPPSTHQGASPPSYPSAYQTNHQATNQVTYQAPGYSPPPLSKTPTARLPELRYGSAVDLVERLLQLALATRATDIHIEPADRGARIRFRIDGICHEVTRLEPEIYSEAVARIKILADLDVTERRRPQDGHIHARIQGADHDLRVASVPARGGEKVGIRIANTGRVAMRLDQLGLMGSALSIIRDIASLPFGMILATGPVGSGKTTTLYSCLNEVDRTQRHVMSIEDPIEFTLDGANHVEVNYGLGFDFVQGLRALLRQDPDTILIGEIRDEETAKIAIRASMTGLMVYSTLHANDAVGAITTLRNFHIPPHLIASSLRGVVAQRLLRKICGQCKAPHALGAAEAAALGLQELPEGLVAFRGLGCNACMGTGYTGRTGVFEIFRIDETVRNLILEEVSERDIRSYVISRGMHTLQQDGLQKIKDGITSIEEFHRVLRFH